MSSPDRPTFAADPAARPRPLAQRLQLLVILLIIPGLAVTLPTLAVTGIFGQRPKSKASAPATPGRTSMAPGLSAALQHSAETLLPTPAPLTADTIRVSVRADHLAARAEKISQQAKALDGSAVEGISATGEKHLFVDLPAGRAEAFRQAVTANESPVVPSAKPAIGAARDQLEVIIRRAADDE